MNVSRLIFWLRRLRLVLWVPLIGFLIFLAFFAKGRLLYHSR